MKLFTLFLLAPLVLSLTLFSQSAAAQQTQLSLVDIITVLRSKKATPAEKNQLLTEGVKQRGVTFALNADLEKELRTAGADEALMAAIREKGPAVKTSATPQLKVEATPSPVSTPKPPDFAFYQNRANSNFVMGEYDEAITDYNKAIELNPKESSIYFSRGLAHFNKQSYGSAISDFDKVIELDPDEAMAFFKRGNALEKTGNFDKALTDYTKAVALDPDNEPAKAAMLKLQAALPKPSPTNTNTANVQKKDPVQQNTPANPTTTPTTTTTTAENSNEPGNFGALNRFAARLVTPVYPNIERQRNTEGLVTVEVSLDEEGRVVSAKATSGPRGLRQAAEDAVRKSKFNPVRVAEKPVKAMGFINFNFKLN